MDNNRLHPGQQAESYAGKSMESFVYLDEQSPIGVLRYTKTLRLVCTWCDNDDSVRNAASTTQAISDSVALAEASGFTEIIFQTNSSKLATFCSKLGFEGSQGEYVKYVTPAVQGK